MSLYKYYGVSCALVIDDKVLIVKRSQNDDFLPGYYELPGGKKDPYESKEEAVSREFLEEVGLRVKSKEFIRKFTYSVKGQKLACDLCYLVVLEEGESIDNLTLSDEHDEYKWVDINEAKTMDGITEKMRKNLLAALNSS